MRRSSQELEPSSVRGSRLRAAWTWCDFEDLHLRGFRQQQPHEPRGRSELNLYRIGRAARVMCSVMVDEEWEAHFLLGDPPDRWGAVRIDAWLSERGVDPSDSRHTFRPRSSFVDYFDQTE